MAARMVVSRSMAAAGETQLGPQHGPAAAWAQHAGMAVAGASTGGGGGKVGRRLVLRMIIKWLLLCARISNNEIHLGKDFQKPNIYMTKRAAWPGLARAHPVLARPSLARARPVSSWPICCARPGRPP
jgi:hypothetical protein